MTTVVNNLQIVPRPPAAAPALRAADRGVADALEAVLSDNTRRVYGTQWRLFESWCGDVDLRSMPAEPLTVARYLAVRAGSGASIATLRLATSAIAKVHEWAGHDSPGRDRGVREALKGWGRRLARPQRQAGALTADVLAVIRLTAPKPRARGRGFETPEQAAERARFDLALVAVLSDGGLRRSEAAALTWGDAQRPALGRRQRPHHRDSLQDRRRSPGRRGGHHPRRHAGLGRHPAGGGWWCGEGVRAVGFADRPTGEGRSSCRRPGGLGTFQRPQRARGHGPAHGPERRAHPRDRTPGPLETGRRHGWALYPGRVRRFGA